MEEASQEFPHLREHATFLDGCASHVVSCCSRFSLQGAVHGLFLARFTHSCAALSSLPSCSKLGMQRFGGLAFKAFQEANKDKASVSDRILTTQLLLLLLLLLLLHDTRPANCVLQHC